VPDVEYTPHKTFLRKRNHKWVKLKSYKGRQCRKARCALALTGLTFLTETCAMVIFSCIFHTHSNLLVFFCFFFAMFRRKKRRYHVTKRIQWSVTMVYQCSSHRYLSPNLFSFSLIRRAEEDKVLGKIFYR